MEMKLFNPKSVSVSEMVLMGRLYLKPFSNFRHFGVKFSPQFCSCRGAAPKVSYSNNIYLSKEAIDGGDKIAEETCVYMINGTNGASPFLYSREMRVLNAIDDEYGGVVVDPESLPANPNAFAHVLHSSLSHWKMKGKKGIWLKLPVERSELVPIAVKVTFYGLKFPTYEKALVFEHEGIVIHSVFPECNAGFAFNLSESGLINWFQEGFEYHHAERGYVMLTYWIPEGPCMLPANASHQVGVGGFVINDKNEVLVVQEKHCVPASAGLWKIPTGFILESEEIFTGAVREVKEETGIDTEFVEVIAFRHAHNVAFEKSDLFFICMLRPLSSQIIVDDLEIQAAKWMPLVEFVKQPLIQGDSMFKKIIDICIARLGKRYCGLSAHHVVSKFDGKPSSLYYNVTEDRSFNCIGRD